MIDGEDAGGISGNDCWKRYTGGNVAMAWIRSRVAPWLMLPEYLG